MDDSAVITAFVAHLANNGHPGLKVDERPDEKERNSPAIDAIAGPFAIEHTSVDTLPGQREKSDWFMQAAGELEKELPIKGSTLLNVTLEYDAITKGQDWLAIRDALKSWIVDAAPSLSDGEHVLCNIRGIPFRLHVNKASGRPPRVFFARYGTSDETLPSRIRKQFDMKIKKFIKYTDKTRVLLVESDDIALMNEGIMREAVQKAYPTLPQGVDQIWYADTSIPSELEFSRIDSTP